jgi:DNA modification methylase
MAKIKWHIETRKLADLKEFEGNPRIFQDKGMADLNTSIDKFGLAEPIVINTDGLIIGGHARYKTLKDQGETEADCNVPDRTLTHDECRELNIRLNANIAGVFDWEAIIADWPEAPDWGLDIPEFALPKAEAVEDDYEIPDEIATDIVLGDLFEIGEHKLLCGDSTQTDTFKSLFGQQMADLVITDPPYNVDYVGKTKDALKIGGDKQKDGDFYQFLYDFYTALGSYTKAGGAWYVWHADSEGANFRKAMADSGIMVKQCLIWVKNSMVMGRQDYQWQHEPCLYGWKEGAAHGWYSDRKQTTVLNFDRPSRSAEHPTMKPVVLFAYQIGNSSKQGDIVADGFGGSGTTMVACHQMQRKAYLSENDPKYCQVIIDRMRKLDPSIVIKKNGLTLETE